MRRPGFEHGSTAWKSRDGSHLIAYLRAEVEKCVQL